ncbi:hypothetical protein ES705_49199 [subsurface metagenome]
MNLRYAQEYGGQKLHLVESHTDGSVSYQALCGRKPGKKGNWRMTINCPLGNACKKCLKVADRLKETTPTVGVVIDMSASV